MATVQEMMMDAAASVETAEMMSAGDTFEGSLSSKTDEDWIRIELSAGMLYTINLSGRNTDPDPLTDGPDGDGDPDNDFNPSEDTILRLYDSKGGFIKMNDDVDGGMGNLDSSFQFTPEVSGTYYISASSYNGNPNQDNSGDYMVTVTEMDLPDSTVGEDIVGTDIDEEIFDDEGMLLYESAGHDKLRGTEKGEMISGLGGNDSLFGFGGDDTLDGGAGDDLLVGGAGADDLKGGEGMDTISYNVSMMGVTINLSDGTARGGDADGDTIGDDIESVIGSPHDDELTGNRGDNSLSGLSGNDELDGGRGVDMLSGGPGDDDLDGGDGNDVLEGGYGADMLTGGDGDEDAASYAGSMMGVMVRLHNRMAKGGDADGDTFEGTVTYDHMILNEDDEMEATESSATDIEDLTGSDHDDVLAGDGRANTIKGGAGDDKIYGGPGGDASTNDDVLEGEDGNDMIWGGVGDDRLVGGGGDDMLRGGPGTDTYDGGAGNDMIYVDALDVLATRPAGSIDGGENAEDAEMPDSDTVSFELFTDEDEGATGVVLGAGLYANIENAIGSDFADNITGSDEDNVIEGGAGGDILSGGGAGNDTLSYENSNRRVRIDLEANSAVGGHATGDTITDDTFENIIGSAYDDVLTGDDAANVLTGGGGDDELIGGDETDAATPGDTLKGGDGEDSLEGGVGDDTLEGGAGADELDGGDDETGANTLSYAGSDAGVIVNLATASASGGHAQGDEIAVNDDVDHDGDELVDNDGSGNNPLEDSDTDRIDVATFRKVTGSDHNDTITGDYRMNVLMGGKGDDKLNGGANWDMLIGGPGADRLNGGESGAMEDDEDTTNVNEARAEDVDWAVYRHAEGGVSVNLDTMRGTGGDAMGDELEDIELVWGSEDAENGDTFIAGAGADLLHGDFGPDTLSYEASNMGVTVDLSDQIAFTAALAEAGPAANVIEESTPTSGVGLPNTLLSTAIPYIVDGEEVAVADADEEQVESNTNGAAGDRIGGIQNLTGSAFGDTLTGDAADNTLMGGDGDDTLVGGDGDDTLMGGDGDDTLSATSGENMLMGGAGDDTITGGSGADTITGGAGDDDLNGSGGDDTFVFSTADSGDSDAILDYTDGDKIDLTAFDDLTAEQVIGAITLRGSGDEAYVVINLTEFGGGRITIDNISDLETLDTATDSVDNTPGVIDTLDESIFIL